MNRLKGLIGEPPEPDRPDDFFEIHCELATFPVSPDTARDVERKLDERPAPRWISFRDLAGARHRVLARLVTSISESTKEQREARRQFRRSRRAEEKSDRSWDDDDWY